jgi:hypothetical protein
LESNPGKGCALSVCNDVEATRTKARDLRCCFHDRL